MDVLVIGAGVNGIGVFRELALQQVSVLLVDKGDYCSGTSAASSHMMHGGLRYLENGEFRLVREALRERNRLLRNAPHHVQPLPTTMPVFRRFSGLLNAALNFPGLTRRPAERGALVLRLGLGLYDWFSRRERALPTHHFSSREDALRRRPALNPRIVCTATWHDAWLASPERLCMELLGDGLAAYEGAYAMNHVSAVGAQGGTVTLRDEVEGATLRLRPRLVINAGGPWIDIVNRELGRPTRWIGGTKGAHLVLAHPQLREACAGEELFFENRDGRITLFFPLEDCVLLGTTDIPAADPDDASVTDEEIDYLLAAVRVVFPEIEVGREHIVFQYCGVRPLPAGGGQSAGRISRDHSIRAVEAGDGRDFATLGLIGGKWTTFRAFAAQAADEALRRLGRARVAHTEALAIGGGRDWPADEAGRREWLKRMARRSGLAEARLAQLLRRYGTLAEGIAEFCGAGEDTMLQHVAGYSRRELIWIAQREAVVHLDDFLLRRSLLAMCGRVSMETLAEAAEVAGRALGWSAARIEQEKERSAGILRERHGARL